MSGGEFDGSPVFRPARKGAFGSLSRFIGQAQVRLATNRVAVRAGERARETSLLRGLFVDEKGTRLSPSHAIKDSRRFRYYVRQTVLQNRQRSTGSSIRVPAHDIERLVREHLHRFFAIPALIDKHFGDDYASPAERQALINAAAKLVRRWEQMTQREQDQLTRLLLDKVTCGPDFVQLSLSLAVISKWH